VVDLTIDNIQDLKVQEEILANYKGYIHKQCLKFLPKHLLSLHLEDMISDCNMWMLRAFKNFDKKKNGTKKQAHDYFIRHIRSAMVDYAAMHTYDVKLSVRCYRQLARYKLYLGGVKKVDIDNISKTNRNILDRLLLPNVPIDDGDRHATLELCYANNEYNESTIQDETLHYCVELLNEKDKDIVLSCTGALPKSIVEKKYKISKTTINDKFEDICSKMRTNYRQIVEINNISHMV